VAEKALGSLSDRDRAKLVLEDRWVPYPAGKAIEEELKFTLDHPRGNRPIGMAIIGHGFNGKSQLLNQFISKNQIERFNDRLNVRLLNIEAPPTPSIPLLYTRLLSRIGDPEAENGGGKIKLERLIILLKRLDVELLIVDEIHDVLAGSPSKQVEFLNTLKDLSNSLKAPVIVSGTSAVENVVGTSFEVNSRYPIYRLPLWAPDKELAEFLVRLEATLPLKNASEIWKMTEDVCQISGGVIGNIVNIINRAAYDAIISGEEKITLKALKCCSKKFITPNGFASN